MEINNHHLCIGCMHELHNKEVCPYCGLDQRSYTPIPRCLIAGMCLADRYVLGKVLGEGSFGITYIGWDTLLEIPVAIKEYYPSDLVSRDVVRGNDTSLYLFSGIEKEEYDRRLERFLKEARNLTRFNQLPAIVSVRDFFYANNTAYIVMDYIEGESLKSYIKREGVMDADRVLRIFRPILESLEKMHATGIIHRDISPDNLLLDADHNLVLIDFGAAELQNAELTRTVTITFKRGFSPEEQYRSHGKQGPWTDIYALCASMYYAMTGIAPDEAIQRTIEDNVVPLLKMPQIHLTEIQKKAVMKGMSVHMEDRYQTVGALYSQLYDDGIGKKTTIPVSRGYRKVAIICICVLGMLCGILGYIWNRRGDIAESAQSETTAAQEDLDEQQAQAMPSCIYHTRQETEQILAAVKDVQFKIEWKESYSEDVMAGLIMSQSILKDTEIERGKTYALILTVSMGPEQTTEPETTTEQKATQEQVTESTTQASTWQQTTESTTQASTQKQTTHTTTQQAVPSGKKKESTEQSDSLDGYIE